MKFFEEGSISSNPNRGDFLIFYRLNARTASEVTSEWGEKYASISKKLKALEYTINEKGFKLYLSDEKTFKVLNHNDMWIPNIMFKYQEKMLQEVLFLDFQLSYFGSPGVDLNYLLYGSVQDKVRETSMKDLIYEYHTELSVALENLNYKQNCPTLQDIHEEISKTAFHAVNTALCLVPLSMVSNEESAEMDVFLADTSKGNAYRKKILMNTKCSNILKKLFLEFDSAGLLD